MHRHQLRDPEPAGGGGQAEADLVAHLAVGEGAAQRRGERDVAGVDVHHLGQHDDVGVGLVGLEVEHGDRGAEPDAIGRRLVIGELAQLVQALVQLAQPRLDELLALEGRLVFGVLPQVTQLDRLGDGLGKEDVEFMAELVDFAAQLLPHLTDHGETRIRKKSLAMGSPGLE